MYNFKYKNIIFPFYLFCVLCLVSCVSLQNKFARTFLNNRNSVDVIVLKPDYLFKSNLKEDSIQQLKTLSQQQKDSICISKSVFLKNVNDSALINTYYQNTINELQGFGLNVITDTTLLSTVLHDSLYYVFNIIQLEMDENYIPYEDKMQVDTTLYDYSFDLNEVALDTWIESSKQSIKHKARSTKVLYAEHTANDVLNGAFERDPLTGNVNYKYKIDKLSDDDMYKLASFSAKKNASYYFDYLMNQYIRRELKKINYPPPSMYFHYNRFYNYLTPVYNNDRFTIIK